MSYFNRKHHDSVKVNILVSQIDHETGKTIKTTAKDTAEMQDMCARILGMERGQRGSKKEHLDALEYKVKIQEKRAALAEHAQKAAEEKQEAASERAKEIAIKNADAVFKLQNKNAELTRTAKEVENLRSQMQFTKGVVDSAISLNSSSVLQTPEPRPPSA